MAWTPSPTAEAEVRILVVDDDPLIRESLREWLERDGYQVLEAADGITALELLDEEVIDVLLLDLALPRVSGLEVLREMRAKKLDIPVVVVSGQGTVKNAVETIKLGAVDFVEKPPDARETLAMVRRAVERIVETRSRRRSLAEAKARFDMVGSGPAMQSVYQQIDRAAPTRARVLILGASGSGKERVAHAIHRLSNRSGGPLVAVNCAAIPEALIEDELFGHVRHAFTDAKGDRAGCFVRADGGTLLLDEISEMSLMTQAKVLRAIETGEVLPVGADAPVKVDVRIVSASNKSLKDEIEQGNFREDLFYRLNVIPIRVPRLAERMEDVEPLVNVFIEEAAAANGVPPKTLTSAARATLMEYAWPGNVRELQNVVERVVIMGSSSQVTGHDVAEALRPGGEPDQSDQPLSLRDARRRFERDYIRRILQEHDWRIQETANVLGINRSHLWRKMQGLGIEDGPDMNGSGNGA